LRNLLAYFTGCREMSSREILQKELRITGALLMLIGGLFEITIPLQDFVSKQSSSLAVWNFVLGIIVFIGIIVIWSDYSLAGGILGIIIGVWIIILEGGVFGLSSAIITLLIIGGIVSISAGILKIANPMIKSGRGPNRNP
jgi:hypothetical protein